MAIVGVPSLNLSAADTPSAMALLRGVESSRTRHDGLQATLTIEYLAPEPSRSVDCVIELDMDRRRFEQFGKGADEVEIVIVDGDELHGFRRKKHEDVHIYDMERAVGVRGDLAFDPRILGLSDLMAADTTVKDCLWYETSDRMEVLGNEQVDDVDVWRVRCFAGEATSDFWIEEPSFRVHRRTIEWPGGRIEIASDFASGGDANPFPKGVDIVRTEPNEVMRRRISVDGFETGLAIPAERFT
ncbi:MAG: hypothetical protein M3552_15805, partial [Planctomycetota bacterium]|nr:hypothetical protein [Planctomycetota bacterium]